MQAKYDIDQSLTGAERTKARKRAAYLANREARIEQSRLRRLEKPDEIREATRRYREENREKVLACQANYRSTRRSEAAARTASWRASDPERSKASKKASYEKNREKAIQTQSAWAARNKDKIKAAYKVRYETKYEVFVAAANARRARKLKATAAWDSELTELVTIEAASLVRKRAAATGIKWHTDHVIPLRGKLVSGLHVWNNLQVIPAIINLKKGRKVELH